MNTEINESQKNVSHEIPEDVTTAKNEAETKEFDSKKQQDQRAKKSSRKLLADNSAVFREFTESTSRTVQKAASILEEEVATGIVTAKQIEEKFINVDELRKDKPDEVMHRFRKDAHEVVDMIIDLVSVATKFLDDFTQRVITISSSDGISVGKSETRASGNLTTLIMPQSVKAGQSMEVEMSLENDSDNSTEEFTFHSTELVDESGNRIPGQQVIFIPTSLSIGPHGREKVIIKVDVPDGTPVGLYSGLIQATKLSHLRAALMVQID